MPRLAVFVIIFALVAWLVGCVPARAAVGGSLVDAASPGQRDWGACDRAIQLVETRSSLPHGLLAAVALTESGRWEPVRRTVISWPWTVNSQGEGHYFDSAAEAIAWVADLQRQGVRSIDVGCMQINLLHHPDAFASLEAAFDPVRNVAYGAGFLTDLRAGTGSLERAVERYHTAELERGRAYRERVFARWSGAGSAAPAATTAWATAAPWPMSGFATGGNGRASAGSPMLSLLAARGVAVPPSLWGGRGKGGNPAVLLPRPPLGVTAIMPDQRGRSSAIAENAPAQPGGAWASTPTTWPAPAGGPNGRGASSPRAAGARPAPATMPFRGLVRPNATAMRAAPAHPAASAMPASAGAPRFLPILRSPGAALRPLGSASRPASAGVTNPAVPRPYREPLRFGRSIGGPGTRSPWGTTVAARRVAQEEGPMRDAPAPGAIRPGRMMQPSRAGP